MGLPLSLPGLHASWAVLSVTSSTVTESGGLGGPGSITRTDIVRYSHMQRHRRRYRIVYSHVLQGKHDI